MKISLKFTVILVAMVICMAGGKGYSQNSDNVIYTTANGTQLECTGVRYKGTIREYKDAVVDYYTFRNGKLYSPNMFHDFRADDDDRTKKVSKLKITKDTISFKDRLWFGHKSNHYKWATIDRHTGEYNFRASKKYHWTWYRQTAMVSGHCKIVEDK